MADKNPFAVLGFAPSIFKGLQDAEILELAGSQFRALSKIFHPDMNPGEEGSAGRFGEIQEAYYALKEGAQFDFWKTLFLKGRKNQAQELEKAAQAAKAEAEELDECLCGFWVSFFNRGESVSFREETRTGSSFVDDVRAFSAFDPPQVTLLMFDDANKALQSQAAHDRGHRAVTRARENPSFQVRILPGGVLEQTDFERVQFDPQKEDMPKVRKELIELRNSPTSRSYYWRAKGKPRILEGERIAGSLKSAIEVSGAPFAITSIPEALIPSGVTAKNFVELKQGYSVADFRQHFRFLRPFVEIHRQAVVFIKKDKELRLRLLGNVRRILAEN